MFKRTKPGFIIILSLFFVIKKINFIFLTNLIGLFRWSYTRSFWSYFTLDLLLNFEIWSLFPSIPTPTIIYVKNYQKKIFFKVFKCNIFCRHFNVRFPIANQT